MQNFKRDKKSGLYIPSDVNSGLRVNPYKYEDLQRQWTIPVRDGQRAKRYFERKRQERLEGIKLAVSFNATNSLNGGSGTSSTSFNVTVSGSLTQAAMAVGISLYGGTAITGATVGGAAASLVTGTSNTFPGCSAIYGKYIGAVSGTIAIVATWTDSSAWVVGACLFEGVDSSTPFINGANDVQSDAGPCDVTITNPANNMGFFNFNVIGSIDILNTPSGQERWLLNGASDSQGGGQTVAGGVTSASYQMSGTQWNQAAGCSVLAASGAAARFILGTH